MSNVLTILRIIGTIPLVFIIYNNGLCKEALILFIILSLTDCFDGYLARKYNKCTEFGKVADGIADKFLMISITIVLLLKDVIPYWTLIIFIRDIISCIFALMYAKKTKVIVKSNIFGKTKTVLHMFSIGLTLLIGKWTIFSSIMLIIAILLFVPECFYILKFLRNRK